MMATIGDRIKEARERAGLSQQQLADGIGVKSSGRQYIYRMEKGEFVARRERVELIAEITGTTPAWIVYGVGEMDGHG